jgi:hypothetical protein
MNISQGWPKLLLYLIVAFPYNTNVCIWKKWLFSYLNYFTFTIPVPQTLHTFPTPSRENFGSDLCQCPCRFQFEYSRKNFGGMLRLSEYKLPKHRFMFTSRHGLTSQEYSATSLWGIRNEVNSTRCICLTFLPSLWRPFGSKHVVELILNKLIVVIDTVYCESYFFLVQHHKKIFILNVSYKKPCGYSRSLKTRHLNSIYCVGRGEV